MAVTRLLRQGNGKQAISIMQCQRDLYAVFASELAPASNIEKAEKTATMNKLQTVIDSAFDSV